MAFMILMILMTSSVVWLIIGEEVGSVQKPYTLDVLLTAPYAIGIMKETIPLIFDVINSRKDILPDYHIHLSRYDEGYGINGVSSLVKYHRNFEDWNSSSNTYPVPLNIGPHISTACEPTGKILHHLDSLALSPSCTSPVLDDKSVYANLYLMTTTYRFSAMGILRFIREIGKWNRFGIITQSGNAIDFSSARFLYETAVKEDFEVDFYDWDSSYVTDETMVALKKSDVRIIVAHQQSSDKKMIYDFLCKAYRYGITGNKYSIIVGNEYFPNQGLITTPDILQATGCNKEILKEQARILIVYGLTERKANVSQTTLQIDTKYLQSLYKNRTGTSILEWLMFRFYDVCQKVVVTLQESDNVLKASHNMSLRSYKDNPGIVLKVVKEAFLNSTYLSLQNGVVRYSPGGYVQNDGQQLSFISPGNMEYVHFATITKYPSGKDFVYGSYYLDIDSSTVPIKLPKHDRAQIIWKFDHVAETIFYLFLALSVVGILANVFAIVTMATAPWKGIQLLGTTLVQVSAVLFLKSESQGNVYWMVSCFIMAVGLSLTCSPPTFYLVVLHDRVLHKAPHAKKAPSKQTTALSGPSTTWRKKAIKNKKHAPLDINTCKRDASKKVALMSLPGLAIEVVVMLVWFSYDCPICKLANTSSFDSGDSLVQIWTQLCVSEKLALSLWLLILAIPQILTLLYSLLMSYQISRLFKSLLIKDSEVTALTAVLLNTFASLILAILANFILHGQTSTQLIVTSTIAILIALTVVIGSLYPKLKSNLANGTAVQNVISTQKKSGQNPTRGIAQNV